MYGEGVSMRNKGKVVQYGNFNVTFEDENGKEQPMLTRFEDIIYPAFMSGIKRGKTDPIFSLLNVELKEINGEIVLVGDFIKNTKYDVFSQVKGEQLESVRREVITAPFSRFVIFLVNHRMVLVKNESKSPDIRSFNSTVEYILDEYVRTINEKISKEKQEINYLPFAIVNIIGLPKNAAELKHELLKLKKIKTATFRLFPLNNDIDTASATKYLREVYLGKTDTKNASITLRSPQSKTGLANLISETQGLAKINIVGETDDKSEVRIKEEDISTKTILPYENNLIDYPDEKLVKYVEDGPIEFKTSKENKKIYDQFKDILKRNFSL